MIHPFERWLPAPPDWSVPWQELDTAFEWIRAMRSCPQDPVHHAEGDVWIHVRMVCETMAKLPEWQALAETDRHLLFASALLHDVAKPACTRVETDRITSRGHSARGAVQARRILWELGAAPEWREQVCAMVRFHQIPYYLIEREDALPVVLRLSQSLRCGFLGMLARADALGRICQDQERLLTNIGLFEELCNEQHCLDSAWPFPSGLSRFEYFQREGRRDPHYTAHDDSRCEVILMSGLPGSGKDTWLAAHAPDLPVIALDDLREELGAPVTGNQGEVIQAAKERARAFLRTGTSFAWNATNLTRDIRSPLIDLITGYSARVRIVHVESPATLLWDHNVGRARNVPETAISRMLDRWDLPEIIEAPLVEYWEAVEPRGWRRWR
jgi:predicted kinase